MESGDLSRRSQPRLTRMPPFPQHRQHKDSMMSHPMRVRPHSHAAAPPVPTWPSYTGTSPYLGASRSGVSVWYDPSLGAPALKNATDLLADADRIRAANDALLGTAGGPGDVIVVAPGGATDGTGGADHMGCDY